VAKGNDANINRFQDVWIYNPERDVAKRLTDYTRNSAIYEQVGWSSSGRHVAITYGPGLAGIEITNINSLSTVEVSNRQNPALNAWPLLGAAADIPPSFSRYPYKSSKPIWTEGDQRVLFMAPTSPQRTALFQVNADGSDLQELLPELQGLVGLPTLSKDRHKLAFVRYPGWQSRERAEIALVDLTTKQLTSLAVLPAPNNGHDLYISGLDWSPDGKYLAFSSNHEGHSSIYIISADGQAWVKLTQDTNSDSVNPIWRP
jgi:Tol biopolymer transport system component